MVVADNLSGSTTSVSDAQRAALERGAIAIATNTTVPSEIVHHYLSGEDLANLEHASKAESGPWFFLFLGATLGNSVSAVIALGELGASGWLPKNLRSLDPVVPLLFEMAFIGGAVAFGIVAWRTRGRTVASICREIRTRSKHTGGW